MKIKHFAGYGSINARVKFQSYSTATNLNTAVVEVSGDHEQGLDRSGFPEDVFKWLSKVIKPKREIDIRSIRCSFSYTAYSPVETGEYIISWLTK